jgi:lipopolysaccharide/colanic/teichoic acid biosynthesis glycosyltransferase
MFMMSLTLFPAGMPVSKRILDLALTAPGLVVISPLMLGLAILVWIKHGRPILFYSAVLAIRGKHS